MSLDTATRGERFPRDYDDIVREEADEHQTIPTDVRFMLEILFLTLHQGRFKLVLSKIKSQEAITRA